MANLLGLIEDLAHYEHDSWSRWMNYLLDQTTLDADGNYVIPKQKGDAWSSQATTVYGALMETEKDSARMEVARVLPVIVIWAESRKR